METEAPLHLSCLWGQPRSRRGATGGTTGPGHQEQFSVGRPRLGPTLPSPTLEHCTWACVLCPWPGASKLPKGK